MGSRNNVLTSTQKEECVKLYLLGKSTIFLAKRYGVYSNAIRGILQRRHVKFRSLSLANRKYKINETFFDTIDTEEKAYILGLFYADGSNNIRRYKAYIMLAEQDVDILEKIRSIISPSKPLLYSKRKNNNLKHQNRYMFYIDNKHISIQLEKLGCVTNKTQSLTFPKWLNKKLYNHFLRGYFDGDGHIGIYGIRMQFSIVSTESFCISIKKIANSLGVTSIILYTRFPERKNNTRNLKITKKSEMVVFLKWLYNNATIYMNRKYFKYLEAVKLEERRAKNSKRYMG